ncbi:MAG TPA: DUF2784 domain-containing protein [Gemmatimonadales bacterium]|nr:DUF2784 domain-containing protein [Gemmatimonadales bacterium]
MIADLVVLFHVAFVLFVVLGGLLVLRWGWVAWAHLPAAAWGAWIEFSGRVCPLTPLENSLRLASGQPAYAGDFVGHYILPVLYPAGLTHGVQVALGMFVVGLNLAIYSVVTARSRRPPPTSPQSRPAT